MNILLDTHTLLWFVAGDSKLSNTARAAIESSDNKSLVSVASLWEMGIKISLGRLDIGMPFDEFVRDEVGGNGMDILAITAAHIARVLQMPFHHRDPFDRLLIAQAEEEGIPIVGCDHAFANYGATLIW